MGQAYLRRRVVKSILYVKGFIECGYVSQQLKVHSKDLGLRLQIQRLALGHCIG